MNTVKIIHENEAVGLGSTIFRGAHLLYYRKEDEILYFNFKNRLYGNSNKNIWSTYLHQPFEDQQEFIKMEYAEGRAIHEYGVFNNKSHPFLFCYGGKQNGGIDFVTESKVTLFRDKLRPYIIFKSDIIDKVNNVVTNIFGNKKILSIHKRGTDLFSNNGHARNQEHLFTYDYIKAKVDTVIDNYDAIFLATDEEETLDNFVRDYQDKIITYATKRAKKGNKTGIHNDAINEIDDIKYLIGEEAIIDTILMSKCDYSFCVRSNLSLLNIILRDDFNYEFIDNHVDYSNLG